VEVFRDTAKQSEDRSSIVMFKIVQATTEADLEYDVIVCEG
jgi:hypothetical protein